MPTYDRTTVTGLLPTGHEPLGSGEERQTSNPEAFGTAVHRLFEWVVRRRGDVPGHGRRRPVVRMLMEEVYPAHKEEDVQRALRMLDGFLASQLWSDLQQARRVLTEHPITWKTEAGAVARGTIDLLFQADDGWRLVDYKTDAIISTTDLQFEIERHSYAEQVYRYVQAWEKSASESVTEGGIWLANVQELLEVAEP